MKHTPRINRINASINATFPTNHDAWWVNNEFTRSSEIVLHRGYGGDDIDPKAVAEHIFRTEKSVHTIFNNSGLITYKRNADR